MIKYIVQRLIISIPMLLGISIVTFVFINLAPGDPVSAMVNPETQAGAADMEHLREVMGLNKPIPVRYAIWLGQLVQGNFGYSYADGSPVLQKILDRFPATLELMGLSLVISTLLGTLLGVLAALWQYSLWDYLLSLLALVGISIPGFFIGLLGLYVFAGQLHLLPAFGMSNPATPPSLVDNLTHAILPATALSLEALAGLSRYARSAMLEVLHADFITTARAKGLNEFVVMSVHAFRNALLPLITVATLRLPGIFGGAIIIETVFQWPGMGLLSIEAINDRDYPVLMGLTFVTAALILFSNLLADVLYAYADPRVRYA
ncbi:MAG: ABC transporter permease [Chloroflexota bacterium]